MKNYRQKLDQLKWLKLAGVEYYFSNEPAEQYLSYNKENFVDQIIELKRSSENLQKKQSLLRPKVNLQMSNSTTGNSPTENSAAPLVKQRDIRQQITSVASILRAGEATGNNNMIEKIEKSRKLADEASSLDQLKEMISSFDGCDLKNLAQNTVFSSGARDAQVMLIGEAPGASEDAQGVPFCGESGKLLDKMLESINLSRETNAYITNTVFWRPPANRSPTQEEIDICRPFVEKHIALIAPKLIILVGATAATSLIGKHSGISNIRKNAFQYSNPYIKTPINMMAIS